MRFRFGFLLLLVPLFAFAREHKVPSGTEGNRLIFTVQNETQSLLEDVQVAIHSKPDWLVFKSTSVFLESIPVQRHRDVEFEFSVLDMKTEVADSVLFVISDSQGQFLSRRVLRFRAFDLPQATRLDPAFPNPANPGTTIQYALHAPTEVKLEIYNILGQQVRRLLNEERPAGTFSMRWDGKNDYGLLVASGTYLVRLTARETGKSKVQQFTSKVLIQK